MASMTRAGGLKRVSANAVRDYPVVITDISCQTSVVEFLDRETARIDGLVAKTTRSIELLKQKRSALITAAVIGKIDVRRIS